MLTDPLIYFFAGMIGTLVFVRLYLLVSPMTNVYIDGYNVHHLYTGALFLIIIAILESAGLATSLVIFFGGVASGLIVDQLVYLVTSSGGHKAYYQKKSLIGMIILASALFLLGIFVSVLVQ